MRLKVKKYRQSLKEESSLIETTTDMSSTSSPNQSTPLIVSMSFPKRGESPRKRKCQGQNRLQKKTAKLEKEKESPKKSNTNVRVKIHRMKKKTQVTPLTPRNFVARLLRNNGLSPSAASKDIQQSLLFSEVLSEEIKGSVHQNRTKKRESIWRVISGILLRKYKLIKYASKKTGNDRRKMGKRKSKIIDFN